ncbi:hypothetical protein [Natronorubrum sp. FCH18a]
MSDWQRRLILATGAALTVGSVFASSVAPSLEWLRRRALGEERTGE